jgi:hypothetical protein
MCLQNVCAKCSIPAVPAAGQPAGSGIQVTPATNQSSNGAPLSQGPSKCFNLTAQQDPNSGNLTQPGSVLVQVNNTSPAQGSQPPSNQTASPNADNNNSPGDPLQCVTLLFSLFRSSLRVLNNTRLQLPILPEPGWPATIRERDYR